MTSRQVGIPSQCELARTAAHEAAMALAGMIDSPAEVPTPELRVLFPGDLPAALGGPASPIIGIRLTIFGEAMAEMLIVFTPQEAGTLLESLRHAPALSSKIDLREIAGSALSETANILAGAYVSALARRCGMRLVISAPSLAEGPAGDVLDRLRAGVGDRSDSALVLGTAISGPGGAGCGRIFFLPQPRLLELVLATSVG